MKNILSFSLVLALAPALRAGVHNYLFSGINSVIPDDDATGLSNTQGILLADGPIASVRVSLEIGAASGEFAFTGDLYAYLQHGSALSVLLNRPGRRPGESFGYDDDRTLSLTFNDSAPHDIHSYRLPLTGSETTPLTGDLTGIWQPDGRAADPSVVLAGDARSAMLGSFSGADPSGHWTLFVADLSSGAVHELRSWGLEIHTRSVSVPDTGPGLWPWLLMGALVVSASRRERKSSGAQES